MQPNSFIHFNGNHKRLEINSIHNRFLSLLSLNRIRPSYVQTFLKPNFSLALFKILIWYLVRLSVMLIFLALSFSLLLKTFSRTFYRANFTITGRGVLLGSLFSPIPCVLSRSANNTSLFSSSLNNFKTLSSVVSLFSSFNP